MSKPQAPVAVAPGDTTTVEGVLDIVRKQGGRVTSSRRLLLRALFESKAHHTRRKTWLPRCRNRRPTSICQPSIATWTSWNDWASSSTPTSGTGRRRTTWPVRPTGTSSVRSAER